MFNDEETLKLNLVVLRLIWGVWALGGNEKQRTRTRSVRELVCCNCEKRALTALRHTARRRRRRKRGRILLP